MPDANGSFIDPTNPVGKSDAGSDPKTTDGPSAGTGGNESLHGFSRESPDTEPLTTAGGKPRSRNRDGSLRKLRGTGGNSAGTGTDTQEKSVPVNGLSSISLESLLYSIHLMGAEFLSVSELELDKGECKKLADAITEVGKYHALSFDPKKVAYFNLAVVAGGIYGSRFLAVRNRQKLDKQSKPTPINAPKKQAPTPQQTGSVYGIPADLSQMSPSMLYQEGSGL